MRRPHGGAEVLASAPTGVTWDLCSLGNRSLGAEAGCLGRPTTKRLPLAWMQAVF